MLCLGVMSLIGLATVVTIADQTIYGAQDLLPLSQRGLSNSNNSNNGTGISGSKSSWLTWYSPAQDIRMDYQPNWKLVMKPIVNTSPSDTPATTFTAPSNIPETLPLVFEPTVTDNQNLNSMDALDLVVSPKLAKVPPVANAGENQTVSSGQEVTLDGRQSSDQDGTIQSFSWRQIEGPLIPLSYPETATPSFTAPEVSTNSSLVYQLNVTDNDGLTGQDAVIITLTPPLPDADEDGILFEVDPEPNTKSVVFSDQRGGGPIMTNGTIDRGEQSITIRDVPNDPNKGVIITAKLGGGDKPAKIEACDEIYSFDSGDELVLTCGSAEVPVTAPPQETPVPTPTPPAAPPSPGGGGGAIPGPILPPLAKN